MQHKRKSTAARSAISGRWVGLENTYGLNSRNHSGAPDHPTPCHTTPKHDVGYPSGLEYMREALQESHVSTCGDATPLGSIGAIDIAIVMPNTVCGHAEGSPQ